jgi:hypothetical protein
MPARGKPVQTPGLPSAGPLFGDTAVATDGSSLPADQGIDLELDSLHYYAVAVPEGNGGLLRTMLAAISGNPNLYLRTHAPPTLSHNAVGGGAPLYDRALTNSVGSEYGNWVPLDSKTEFGLAPGLWYLAVHAAGGSHVRYRLQCSIGNISDLAFDGGRLDRQALLAGDWCYYRVQLPGTMPNRWTISFAKQQGDVAVYLRDAVPPGLGLSASNYVDWNQDRRNHGPYPFFTEAGSSTLSVPPVRPGAEYYLGVRAVSDGVFSIGSAAGTQLIPMDIIPFNGGSATRQIAPGESLLYRIEVPAGTQKWSHTSTHPSSVRCYLDQGTVPTFTTADHWFSTGPNSSLDARLVGSSWPWLAGYSYYLGVTNTSATTQSFSLRMAGQGLTARLGQAFIAPDGRIGFSITGASNLVFRVQFSPTLAPASWGDRSDYELSPGQAILLPILTDQPAGFYRLRF